MSDEVKLLPCTQADREAAANIVQWQIDTGWEPQFFHPGLPKGMREGAWDNHPVVQAFAAHTRPPIGTDEVVERDETSGVSANDPRVCIRLRDALIELRAAVSHHFGAKHPNPAVIEEAMERARVAIAAMKDAASD